MNRSTTRRLLCRVIIRQEERGRRQGGGSGGGGGGVSGGNSSAGRGNTGTHGAETPSNLASITPTAREVTRTVITRQRLSHKTCDVRNNNNNNNSKENLLQETNVDCDSRCHVEPPKNHYHHHHHHHHQQHHQSRGSNVTSGIVGNVLPESGGSSYGDVITCDKYKGTASESNRGSDAVQGRPSERSMLKIEKLSGKTAVLHGGGESAVNKCGAERMKSTSQEVGYNKHEVNKVNIKNHDVGHGYKVENLRYYGELKGYTDFKAYGTVDKQPVSAHEKSHLLHAPTSCEKGDKCHNKAPSSSAQGYSLAKIGQQQAEKSHHGGDHYYHRSSHSKSNVYQVYQETKYSYNVSGVPGTPAQASAAAAFFARSVFTQSSEYDSTSR